MSASWDVLGLGQVGGSGGAEAMVDMAAAVDDSVLERLHAEKGARKIIGVEERTAVLEGLDGEAYQVCAGGSLSNTLMALARLGQAAGARGGRPLRVAMAGVCGEDALGSFYAAQMRKAGVEVLSEPVPGANTGTVVVLTSPDAQRTMLSYLGTPCQVPLDARLEAAIARSRVLVVEGYLWELPGAAEAIGKAIEAAQKHGTIVAMTAGDAGVVERHHSEMWQAIDRGIDLLFTNRTEAEALCKYLPAQQQQQQQQQQSAEAPQQQHQGALDSVLKTLDLDSLDGHPHHHHSKSSGSHAGGVCSAAEAAALRLGPHCSLVVVTDGSAGSHLTALGQLHTVPPCWAPTKPVDTCGAGDGYAAGLLYGFLRGFDVASMGRVGARVASAVISHIGSALSDAQADALVEHLPLGADRSALRRVNTTPDQQQQQQVDTK
ncbi:hypothetical protein N2152v2_009108 [Parachlorella kessleri]